MDAVRKFGVAKIARALGISTQAISQWHEVPDGRVLEVAAATDYALTPHVLRPDLYPYPADGLPPERRPGCECSMQGAV